MSGESSAWWGWHSESIRRILASATSRVWYTALDSQQPQRLLWGCCRLERLLRLFNHLGPFAGKSYVETAQNRVAVGSLLLGAGDGRHTVRTRLLHRHLPRYPFISFLSALKKRQSVPWAMIFWGVLLIRPISCRRNA
jgi:hypothetical protein